MDIGKIRHAQIIAGEKAVVDNLKRMGLVPDEEKEAKNISSNLPVSINEGNQNSSNKKDAEVAVLPAWIEKKKDELFDEWIFNAPEEEIDKMLIALGYDPKTVGDSAWELVKKLQNKAGKTGC